MTQPHGTNQFGPPRPLWDRFWEKVDQSGNCWEWTAARGPLGYGSVGVGRGMSRTTHRVAWELTRGPIPAGMYVCHRCDNPPCVRPSHLYLGTPGDNLRDAVSRGRRPDFTRSKNPNAKLTEDQVDEIRRAYAAGGVGHRPLAEAYGVSRSAIRRLVGGKSW